MTEREPTFSRCPGDKRVDRIAHRSWRQVLTAGLVALLLAACGGGDVSEDPRREPLAVTTTAVPAYDRDDLYRFFAIAFGAAPGVTYMGQLVEAAEVGRMSIKEIVNVFTTKSQFLETYPASLTNQEYAQKLVDNVVGTSANAAAKAEAVADIVEALKLPNWTRGDITYAIFNNLAKKPADDAKWAGTAKKMANQVAYARHYTETMKVDTTDLLQLRAVVKTVTESSPVNGVDLGVLIQTAVDQARNQLAAVGVASFKGSNWGTSFSINKDKVLSDISGTHTVAIYRVPAGKEAQIGPGKLTISGSSTQWSAKLETANGELISDVSSVGAIYQGMMGLQGPVKMTLNAGSTPAKFIDFTILGTSGDITGSAGGFGEYGFRNNVVAYGPAVPAVLSLYAGAWKGPQQALNCGRPTVTLTVNANGTVTNAKGAGSCQAAQVSATWDGNDDFVGVASEGGYEIQLDSSKIGGSQPQGGIRILVADVDNRGPVASVSSGLAGSAGNIIANYPLGEIAAGSESKVSAGPNGQNLLTTCPVPAEAGTYSLLVGGGYGGGPPCINGIRSLPQTQTQFCESLFVRQQLLPGVISFTCTWDSSTKSGKLEYPFGPLNVLVTFTYAQR